MAHKNYHLLWPLIVAVLLTWTRAQGERPTDVTVFQRDSVLLTCSGGSVRWFRLIQQSGSSLPVTEKIFTSPDTWHVDRGTKYDTNGTYNLVIKDAQADTDAGTYQCDTDENPNQLLNANLVVLGSLILDVNPEGHLARDMTIDITCTARYGGPAVMSAEQDPSLMLTLDNTPAFPTGQVYYEAPEDGSNFHVKKLVVNYTLTDETPGRHLRCTLRSMNYELEEKQMLNIKFPPIIAEIEEREYNTSDSITCSADGIPIPSVTWTHISGSMPESSGGSLGRGQAVLTNLADGSHVWMCTARNDQGTVSVNVSFTVSGVAIPGEAIGGSKVGIAIGLAIGLGLPITIAIIVIVCLLMRRKKDKQRQPPAEGGDLHGQPTDPDKPAPINNEHRPPRPRSDLAGQPNVNVNPNPAYQNTPVYPEQYGDSPTKPSSDRPDFGDLGVRPIHVGGSTPSLNRSYESSQRESGTDDRFQGPNTSV